MNKKGYSASGWVEVILLVSLFVTVTSLVIGEYNDLYQQSNDMGLGIETDSFKTYQKTAVDEVKGGEAETSAQEGITFKGSWAMTTNLANAIWTFISGNFIDTLCNYMHLPSAVAWTVKLLYFLSVLFIILRILFKISP